MSSNLNLANLNYTILKEIDGNEVKIASHNFVYLNNVSYFGNFKLPFPFSIKNNEFFVDNKPTGLFFDRFPEIKIKENILYLNDKNTEIQVEIELPRLSILNGKIYSNDEKLRKV